MKSKIIALLLILFITFSFTLVAAKGVQIQNPAVKIGSVKLGEKASGTSLLISDGYLYVFGGKTKKTDVGENMFHALWIFSLKNPAEPEFVGGWFPENLGQLVGNDEGWTPLLKYKNLIFASGTSDICVIDVSNPKSPKLIKTLMEGGASLGIGVYSHYLLAYDISGVMHCFDISDNFKSVNVKVEYEVNKDDLCDFMPLGFFIKGNKLFGVGSGVAVADLSGFPVIKVEKFLKDENGDPLDLESAKLFENFIVGSAEYCSGYGAINTESESYTLVKVSDLQRITLHKFAKEGRTLYAVSNKEKELYAMDTLDILHPKLLWRTKISEKVNDIGVYMGYIYLLSGNLIITYNSAPFEDVPTDYWAVSAIKYMVSKNIISGYPDGTFKPDKIVTRAEYAKMLALSLNLDVSKGRDIYTDVPSSHWAYKYITAVTDAKLMKGYGHGKFGPNDTVKKEEIITTIVRLKHWEMINPETGTFPDVPKKYWAYPYIETAVKNGLIRKIDRGLTDGKFHIKVGATRAQTAELLYRAINKK